MVLLTLRVAVGQSTKSKDCVLVLGEDFVDDPIHAAVAKHDAITLASVKIFATADEKPPGSTLSLEHLGAITADEVASNGKFLVLTCTNDVAQAPQPRANIFEAMMRQEIGLPPLAVGQAYNFQLFNALVNACAREKLGFPAQEVATSGYGMLAALRSALQYVLKFDDAGVLKKRHYRLPLRFTTEELQVFPSTKRNGDGKPTDERLDTQKVLAASIEVYKHIDATR